MSLILRKQCQEGLNKEGLSHYHIQIAEHGKHLQIVGECGKPLVEIFGIRFTKMSPAAGEIDYAAELFTEFLLTHGATIHQYVIKATAFQKLKEIKKTNAPFGIEEETNYDNKIHEHVLTGYTISINDGIMQFSYRTDKKGGRFTFKSGTVRSSVKANPEGVTDYIANKTLLIAAKKYIKEFIYNVFLY